MSKHLSLFVLLIALLAIPACQQCKKAEPKKVEKAPAAKTVKTVDLSEFYRIDEEEGADLEEVLAFAEEDEAPHKF